MLTSLDGLSGRESVAGTQHEASDDSPADGPAGESSAPDANTDAEGGVVQSRYASAVLADGPVLYFRFGEADGEAELRDEISGLKVAVPVTGVRSGAAGALADDANTAVIFDGTGHLMFPAGQEFEGFAPFTVEVWVKQPPTTDSLSFIVDHEEPSAGRAGWDLFGGSSIGFERRTSSAVFSSTALDSPSANAWHHVVATTDGATQFIFVDGVLAASNPATVAVGKVGVPYAVGGQNCLPCANAQYVGALDELAIYDKALSVARIAAHFAAGR